ncbi:MAG: ATP-binding protein [Planctomycetaceae bacterium]
MARADLLTDLVASGTTGDRVRFRKAVEALIAEERAKKHTVLAERLVEILEQAPAEKPTTNGTVLVDNRGSGLVLETIPQKRLDDLVLPAEVLSNVHEVITEHHRADLLRTYSLEPRSRILLIGPPGNGKTSLAEAIAESLMVPLLHVRYESIIGAYLGETAVRLRKLLDYAKTRNCVLFFDEFETLGKERGDAHETGEIKRVVSSLLMQMDSLPNHVVVIGATNHPELLDRAVWRRFQVRLELPKPSKSGLVEWLAKFEKRIGQSLGYAHSTLSKKLAGFSFSELEEFGLSAYRRYVLALPEAEMKKVVDGTLKDWKSRSVTAFENDGGNE